MTQSEIIDLLENFQKESSVNNIYNLIKYFRIKGQFKLCKLFYSTLEVDGELQGHLEGYRLRLLYEYSIFAWYLGIEHRLVIPVFMELFCSGLFDSYSLLGNYKFYRPILKCERSINISYVKTNGKNEQFFSSSPSIVPIDGEDCYLINVRFVNYKIAPDGTYPWLDCYTTINKCMLVRIPPGKEFEIETLYEQFLEDDDINQFQFNGCSYCGIEDLKLFNTGEKILFTGTYVNETMYTVWGHYLLTGRECNLLTGRECNLLNSGQQEDNNKLVHTKLIYPERNNICEKNWVFVPTQDNGPFGNNLVMIYSWHPLVIGTIECKDDSLFKEIKRIDTSPFLSGARGSTNGFLFGDEIWFVVHFVHKLDKELRNYFHAFVILDKLTLDVKRYSAPFKITESDKNEIEYCLGLVVEKDRVLVTHSCWDRESYIKIYSKCYLDKFIF